MSVASVEPPRDAPVRRWRDPRLLLWPLGLLIPLLPLRTRALDPGAPMLVWFLTPIIVFGVFPIVDTLIGHDRRNPPESETARLESVRYYRWITYAYIPLQYLSLALACSMWASGDLTWWQSLGPEHQRRARRRYRHQHGS